MKGQIPSIAEASGAAGGTARKFGILPALAVALGLWLVIALALLLIL